MTTPMTTPTTAVPFTTIILEYIHIYMYVYGYEYEYTRALDPPEASHKNKQKTLIGMNV